MMRTTILLVCLAVLGLSVAVVWAAEDTSWAAVKSATEVQPAAKAAVQPLYFLIQNPDFSVPPGDLRTNKSGMTMQVDPLTTWDVVTAVGVKIGTLENSGGHSFTHTMSGLGQENFYACFTLTLGELSGTFEGRVETRLVLGVDTQGSYCLHGTGDFAGMTFKGRMWFVSYTPPPSLNITFAWEGDILAPHGMP